MIEHSVGPHEPPPHTHTHTHTHTTYKIEAKERGSQKGAIFLKSWGQKGSFNLRPLFIQMMDGWAAFFYAFCRESRRNDKKENRRVQM